MFKKKYKFQKYFFHMQGLKLFVGRPIPDFLIFLDHDKDAFFELKKFQIPMISLLDTNMNPENYLYNFFGNNDCIENIEFFFEFLKETIKEGRLKEQQLFYSYFMFKLKKYFNN
jgi:ribosomal protein S2